MSKLTLTTLTVLATTLMAGTGAALAHYNEARQDEQAQAIEQGRRDGSITWREGRQLRKDQREIAQVKDSLEADGRLTRDEKRVLYKMQDAAEDHIAVEATDSWHRAWWLPRFAK